MYTPKSTNAQRNAAEAEAERGLRSADRLQVLERTLAKLHPWLKAPSPPHPLAEHPLTSMGRSQKHPAGQTHSVDHQPSLGCRPVGWRWSPPSAGPASDSLQWVVATAPGVPCNTVESMVAEALFLLPESSQHEMPGTHTLGHRPEGQAHRIHRHISKLTNIAIFPWKRRRSRLRNIMPGSHRLMPCHSGHMEHGPIHNRMSIQ